MSVGTSKATGKSAKPNAQAVLQTEAAVCKAVQPLIQMHCGCEQNKSLHHPHRWLYLRQR